MNKLITLDKHAVSRFAFGTMQFGGTADAKASASLFEASLEAGINHFDTAHIYTDGHSETILGALAKPVRDQILIATKVAYDGNGDVTKMQIDFDTSRQRLGMDSVDILYLLRHVGADLSRALAWMASLQNEGAIRYIGLSNFAAWQVMDAVAIAKSQGTRIDIIQPMYNLVKRQAEVELLPMCMDQNITCAPYSPLGGGLLTGKYAGGAEGRLTTDSRYNARYSQAFMHETANALNNLAKDLGINPATLAVAWVARHDAKPIPLLSARSVEQLKPSIDAINFKMDDALYELLTALSPTPPPATDRWEERV